MDNTLIMWISIVVISLVGTLAHFVYDWAHENKVLGLFAAVNESTWEHIKIALTASFLWGICDGYLYGIEPNYFCAKLFSLLILAAFIPCAFYAYRRFTAKSILALDIAIFYIAIILSQFTFYGILNLPPMYYIFQYISCLGLFVFFGCYMTLTLDPIKNFLFKDPINGRYGFRARRSLFAKARKRKSRSKSRK